MIPLTIRSHYSFMWGTAAPERICRKARELGYSRLALTDTDNLCGLWPFLAACERHGISPVVGAEVTDRKSARRAVCLVENETGYKNLCRLISRRHMDDAFDLEAALTEHGGGLAVLVQDPALLAALSDAGLFVAAAMPRRPRPFGHRLRAEARRLGTPVVATPGSFFLSADQWPVHRVLRAIDGNTALSRLGKGDAAPADAFPAAPREYERRFEVCPEALRNTEALAERLTFTGPEFGIVLPPWKGLNGRTADAALGQAAHDGAERRYGKNLSKAVTDRLEYELAVIGKMGFSSYFLVVRDIVARSPRTCGRGSGAASIVAYCLGITNVCPVRHNLYFDRFLNPGRKDAPDIDVDFPWDERDDVLAYVLKRHGGHAAMVANHVCFQPRMAVREVAKVYGIPEGEIRRISKHMPMFWRLEEADPDMATFLKERPEARELDLPKPWPEILTIARRILGAPRYLSVHPGGMVITPDPIDTYVPIQQTPKGVPIVQWEKDGVEASGLVKIDLLGNRSLGVIRDAVAGVRENGGEIDELRWRPEEDLATRKLVAAGRTMGCFYIESPAMRLLQEKAGRGDFEHLVIHSSIIRPAANEYIQEYLARLHGAPWEPIHPLLSEVLADTFGIMVYQEDVSRVATTLAGFSPSDADGLRKILSKKERVYALRDYHARFRDGAAARGVSEIQIEKIWRMILSFDGYSFCKPHSASYARVSFQAAWLKRHFPAEFMAAVISNQGGFYSAFAYVSEARRMGLTVLSPDVNRSRVPWSGREKTLRVGLLSVKGLPADTRARIVAERERTPFKDLTDFLRRVAPHEDGARKLAACGALDLFSPGDNRGQLMWALSRWYGEDRTPPQNLPLFAEPAAGEIPMPPLPPDDPATRLRREFSVLGFLCRLHPMSLFRDAAERWGAVSAKAVPRNVGRRVSVAGWLITGKKVRTKGGESMEFLTFEDETGIVETTFFPKVYHRFCHLLDPGRPYLVSGKVEENWGAATLTVDAVSPLRSASPLKKTGRTPNNDYDKVRHTGNAV